jgi:hypothetical protein
MNLSGFPNGAEADYRLRDHGIARLGGDVAVLAGGSSAGGRAWGDRCGVVVRDYQNPSLYTRRHQQKLMELAERYRRGDSNWPNQARARGRHVGGAASFWTQIEGSVPRVIQENEDRFWHLNFGIRDRHDGVALQPVPWFFV